MTNDLSGRRELITGSRRKISPRSNKTVATRCRASKAALDNLSRGFAEALA